MNLLSWLVFLPLQLLFVPLALAGAAFVGYRQIWVSRRLGVSQTGIEILNGRLAMHWFGLRHDPASEALAKVLPNDSVPGLWLTFFPLWVKYKISGRTFAYPRVPPVGEETLADMVAVRTLHFDALLERALGQASQCVALGAGYDTRALGFAARGIRSFELDQRATQQVKLHALERAGIDPSASGVTFVEVDFDEDGGASAFEALQAGGFDPQQPTVFLWEGVTLYLSEAAVLRTLQLVYRHAAPGSSVLLDVYGERMLRMAKKGAAKKALEFTDEAMAFGLDFGARPEAVLEEFIGSTAYELGEQHFLGSSHRDGPYMAVVELRVASA